MTCMEVKWNNSRRKKEKEEDCHAQKGIKRNEQHRKYNKQHGMHRNQMKLFQEGEGKARETSCM
jgi:hypothetical protein